MLKTLVSTKLAKPKKGRNKVDIDGKNKLNNNEIDNNKISDDEVGNNEFTKKKNY